ncbi:MAG: hypothetical protein AAF849_15080 [Bacteroidota bacterium]
MKIRIANPSTAECINQLRLNAYKAASDAIILDYSFLYWNKEDETSTILFIENDSGKIISSMRAKVLTKKKSVEAKFDIRMHDRLELPALILDRACTDIRYRGHRLSAILRHLFISACLDTDVKNILTTVNAGAKRIPVMESVGYRFQEADTSHRTNNVFKNNSKVLLGNIHRSIFPQAAIRSREVLDYQLEAFEIVDGFYQNISKSIEQAVSTSSSAL